MATRSTTASGMLLALALTLTLTLTALQMQLASVEALPITSRPIEGNAQLLAWEEWQRLTPDQRTLEKEKKVTAKSIFTLPFRHCPPDHKRFGDSCIPQINIDPTDLIKQELLIELNPGGSAPSVNLDYDYSDSDGDEDSDELFINVPLMQKGQLLPPLQPNDAAEDQALPSEDAPLKFNIFENKYPMTLDTAAKSTATTATTTTTVTTTETTTAATATATATTTAATVQQSSNRIATQLDDLLADSSVALPSTTTLSISLPPSSSNIDDFGSIEAIVVPAGLPVNEKASIQLVTKADAPSTSTATATSTTTAMLNADADEQQQQQQQHNEKELQMNEERVQPSEDDGEEALAQLLKVDTLLPATAYGSSVDLLPPFSHRRVAPLLSADLDDADESAATDVAPTADATPTTATATAAAAAAATTSATTAKGELDAQGENRVVLKKSKVQPVQLSSTVATTTPTSTPTTATATTIATPTTIAESSSATTTTTTTTAAAEVEATATATTTSDTAAVTTTTTVAAAAAAAAADEGDVAAIHQDANGNAKDDDRFYYQHSDSTTSSTTATATATSSSSSSNTVADAVDLDELNYMAASDNLMTNTIGGQGDSEKAAGEMNFEQELSIINELVKGKWRLSQLRQQQQQQQLLNSSGSSSTTTAATTTSVESSEVTSSTPAASENTTFWSKLMPMLSQSQSSTEATTAATTDETAETIPATATASTTAQSSVADTSIATATTAATTTAATTTTAAAATTSHLSINTNRSNRNSKIIRIDSIVESSTTTTTTTTTTPATPTVSSNSSNAAAYTPFWWLPNFGVRLDRQVDENGEDRSLLLRFFRPFRAGNTAEDATRITTLPSRR